MEKVFLDTDIIVDLLSERAPHHQFAEKLFITAEDRKIQLFISALTFPNAHYILRKQFNEDEALSRLETLRSAVSVLPLTDQIIDSAIHHGFPDFEDAIQLHTALTAGATVLLTRNLRDFRNAIIPVFTADQFLDLPQN